MATLPPPDLSLRAPYSPAALNRRFDALLLRDPDRARVQSEELHHRTLERGCRHDGVVLPTFLKPELITVDELAYHQKAIPHLMRCVSRLVTESLRCEAESGGKSGGTSTKARRAVFARLVHHLPEAEREWALTDPGVDWPIVVTRLDGFQSRGRLSFLEFNVDSPAGMGYADIVESELVRAPICREFSRTYPLKRLDRRRVLLKALLAVHADWRAAGNGPKGGGGRKPTIAIVDLAGVATEPEFDLIADAFRRRGVRTVIGDPRELTLSRNRLVLKGTPIDICYRRTLLPELVEVAADVKALRDAARKQLALVVNPFCSRLASSKAILHALTDPLTRPLWSAAERELIERHIPWTRELKLSFVEFEGETADIVSLLRDRRTEFVLKPIRSYGGQSVYLGCETDAGAWDHVLHTALMRGDFIAQRYVPIPRKKVPMLNPDLELVSKKVNTNPFCFGGQYGGSIARVSDSSVINVKLGGGILATMTARPPDDDTLDPNAT